MVRSLKRRWWTRVRASLGMVCTMSIVLSIGVGVPARSNWPHFPAEPRLKGRLSDLCESSAYWESSRRHPPQS